MKIYLYITFILISLSLVPSCSRPVELGYDEYLLDDYRLQVFYTGNSPIKTRQYEEISSTVTETASNLDPLDEGVLGALNNSEPGTPVLTSLVTSIIGNTLEYSYESNGAFDPTLQILWDVYDFELGGRFVSENELASALQWVDKSGVEFLDDSILRTGENVRFGLGPAYKGALLDLFLNEIRSKSYAPYSIALGGTGVGHEVVACISENELIPLIFDIVYPVNQPLETSRQDIFGHISLDPGDFVAALDDDEGYFFSHGNRYHMVLDPTSGKPTDEVREVVIISRKSCLHAFIMAYAVMVMGKIRGLEFLDENPDIEGVILLDEGETHVSSGLEKRFWK